MSNTIANQTVLLLGATGETGGSILNALIASRDAFSSVEALVRPSSAGSKQVQKLQERGVKIRVIDITQPVPELAKNLAGVDVLISAIDPGGLPLELNLASAAKEAGVKRFVPCAFTIVAPPGGVMALRDSKEEVYQHIRKLYLPYTIIDVGYWHQISFPMLSSGRIDYAGLAPRGKNLEIHAGGDAPTMLTDLRDIGTYVVRIIQDQRTLNKFVVTYSDVISENEIFALVEKLSGEKVERIYVSAEEMAVSRARAAAGLVAAPQELMARMAVWAEDYKYSKYVRGDNTPAYAKYLGYLDANELYPDYKPISFQSYVEELLEGKAEVPYKAKWGSK